MRVKNIGFWIILLSIITLIFSPAIIYPFFQDDFFALVTTKITSLSDIWRLFLPVSEAVYYRPLGIQLYFGLMQFVGLGKPIWFHLMSLLVHLLNTYLIYRLTVKIFSRERLAKLTAFLWGTSPIHYFALGWAVNFSFVLVITWSILAILAAGEGKGLRAILFLFLGLMTNEIAVVIPLLVILLNGGKRLIIPMLTAVAGYGIWRMLTGVKIEGDYVIGLTTVVSTLRWYGLWILGWSDIVRDFIRWGAVFRPEFIKIFPAVVWVYAVELAAVIILLGRLFQKSLRAEGRQTSRSVAILGFSWMLVGLLPVMFFSRHIYSHYGAVAAIGVYWLAAEAVNRRQWMAAAVIWLMVAITTLGLNYQVSWMADHAAESRRFQGLVLDQIPKDEVSRIYIVSDVPKAQTVLLGGYGVEYLTGVNKNKVIFVSSLSEVLELKDDEEVIFL